MSRVAGGQRTRVSSDQKLLQTHLVLPLWNTVPVILSIARSLVLSSLSLSLSLLVCDNEATYTNGQLQQLVERGVVLELRVRKQG
jgi:hypothetical protein